MGNVLLTTYLSPELTKEFDKKREDRPTALFAKRLIEYGLPKLGWCNSCQNYSDHGKSDKKYSNNDCTSPKGGSL